MKITLDIPEALAEQLRAEAEARGEDLNHYAVAKLKMPVSTDSTDEEAEDDLIDSLRAGLAVADAGRTLSLKEADTRIRTKLAERNAVATPGGSA